MKKIILAAVVAMFSLTSCGTYNGMVEQEEAVKSAWSNVETQYQRRADLIPNLVSTVKGYASHEESTLTAVVDARSKATSVNISMDELTPEKLAEYQKAQSAVTSALGRLIAVSENYPELKANQNFLELQAQLEGTENRITVARKEFNDTTNAYNVTVRKFPANIVAMIFGFDQKPYFEADASASQAPKVEF
jgi:LemA protein